MLAPNTLMQGRYQIVRLLAQGGMGAVYEAIDLRLKARVALKQLILRSEPHLVKAFEREAQILAGLHHPALPVVHDHFIEGDAHFLVMQFIPGPDLAEHLQQRGQPFPVDDVLDWADTLLDALDYLHSQQPPIIHRDIKPGNLKLSPRGGIILLDFGLAKGAPEVQSHLTGVNSLIIGYTPSYAPPEQVQRQSTGHRSDLYALSATLYDLLTNIRPVAASERIDALVNRQPDPLRPTHEQNPTVPLAISAAVHHGMALGVDDRPGSAAELRAEFRAARRMTAAGAVGAPTGRAAPVPPASTIVTPPSSAAPTQVVQRTAPAPLPNASSAGALRRRPIYLAIVILMVLMSAIIAFNFVPPRQNNGNVSEAPTSIASGPNATASNAPAVASASIAASEPTSVSTPSLPPTRPPNAIAPTTPATQNTLKLVPFFRDHPGIIKELVIIDGIIWAATEKGLVRVKADGTADTFTKKDGLFNYCAAIVAAPDKSLWIAEHDVVNIRPSGDAWSKVSEITPDVGQVNTLYVDKDGTVWAGGAYGAKRVSVPTQKPDPPVDASQVKDDVRAFLRSEDELLWVGHTKGVMRWDGEKWDHFGEQDGITMAFDLAESPDEKIWAAAGDGGLLRFDGTGSWQRVEVLSDTDDIATVVYLDGALWVSGRGIIARSTDGGNEWTNMDQDNFAQGSTGSIVRGDDGKVWVHSYEGIYYFEPEK